MAISARPCTSDIAATQAVARLDIWSFNLRTEFQEAVDGPDGWSRRRKCVADFILARRPCLVCVQEATEAMLAFLSSQLGEEEYGWMGTSRTPGRPDEMAGFLFDKRRLEAVEHRASWLGPAGAAPGAPCWDAAYPRTWESAVFRVLLRPDGGGGSAAPRPVYVRALNTHLDHVGVEARARSAELLAATVARLAEERPDCPQVLCGDFNSPKGGGNAVYELLAAGGAGLRDAAREAPSRRLAASTIHKFRGLDFSAGRGDGTVDLAQAAAGSQGPQERREEDARHIDWVLWRDAAELQLVPLRFEVVTDRLPSGRYPSDHFPVSATFELRRRQAPTAAAAPPAARL